MEDSITWGATGYIILAAISLDLLPSLSTLFGAVYNIAYVGLICITACNSSFYLAWSSRLFKYKLKAEVTSAKFARCIARCWSWLWLRKLFSNHLTEYPKEFHVFETKVCKLLIFKQTKSARNTYLNPRHYLAAPMPKVCHQHLHPQK